MHRLNVAILVTSLALATTLLFAQTQPIDRAASRIGNNDLLSIKISDVPEVSGTYRVMDDGQIRMPLVREKILAAGLLPAELEVLIAKELKHEQLVADPFVTVSVVHPASAPKDPAHPLAP